MEAGEWERLRVRGTTLLAALHVRRKFSDTSQTLVRLVSENKQYRGHALAPEAALFLISPHLELALLLRATSTTTTTPLREAGKESRKVKE